MGTKTNFLTKKGSLKGHHGFVTPAIERVRNRLAIPPLSTAVPIPPDRRLRLRPPLRYPAHRLRLVACATSRERCRVTSPGSGGDPHISGCKIITRVWSIICSWFFGQWGRIFAAVESSVKLGYEGLLLVLSLIWFPCDNHWRRSLIRETCSFYSVDSRVLKPFICLRAPSSVLWIWWAMCVYISLSIFPF